MSEILLMLGIFAFTSVVSYVLISRVPQRLHTPLMSFTNAISAVTILGALLLFTEEATALAVVLGGAAIVLAAFNLIGGFAITGRMARMFRQ
ncbi:MAG: NAD(P) transhydrogenase subunit alpha [Coriobacteriia bacterium]|nr:NAD(P) transhydrogenase subunit alpha [Coriobacteriia bacterium]